MIGSGSSPLVCLYTLQAPPPTFPALQALEKNMNYLYHEKTILDYCHGKIPFSEENIILNIELFFSLHLLKKSRVVGKSKVSNIPM